MSRVLIVDGNPLTAERLRTWFQGDAYEFLAVQTPAQALNLLLSTPVDLAMIDVPTLARGATCLLSALAQGQLSGLPVIFLSTAYPGTEVICNGQAFVATVRKPVDCWTLRHLLHQAIGVRFLADTVVAAPCS